MPWEKSFDMDEALDRAIRVFWKKGYEGASMADLIAGMGINKGSLYNAFGSKKALFDQALLRYDQQKLQAMLNDLESLEDPVQSIAGVFDGVIAEAEAKAEVNGCFLVNTAIELPNRDDDVKTAVKASLGQIENFFDRMIRSGQAKGTISSDVTPSETAKALLSMVLGIRVLDRGAADGDTLAGVKAGAMRLIR